MCTFDTLLILKSMCCSLWKNSYVYEHNEVMLCASILEAEKYLVIQLIQLPMTTQRLQLTYTALMVLFVALFTLPLSTQAEVRESCVVRSADDAVVCGERKADAAMAKSSTGYITQEETPAEKYYTVTIESEHGRVVLRDGSTVLTTEDLKKVKKGTRSEEHTSELQSRQYLVCRLL